MALFAAKAVFFERDRQRINWIDEYVIVRSCTLIFLRRSRKEQQIKKRKLKTYFWPTSPGLDKFLLKSMYSQQNK